MEGKKGRRRQKIRWKNKNLLVCVLTMLYLAPGTYHDTVVRTCTIPLQEQFIISWYRAHCFSFFLWNSWFFSAFRSSVSSHLRGGAFASSALLRLLVTAAVCVLFMYIWCQFGYDIFCHPDVRCSWYSLRGARIRACYTSRAWLDCAVRVLYSGWPAGWAYDTIRASVEYRYHHILYTGTRYMYVRSKSVMSTNQIKFKPVFTFVHTINKPFCLLNYSSTPSVRPDPSLVL